mmetsp:Transcript_24133/g.77851  ORF Transcript_24133/g.77851 Transcript_24133/m.77851 type:complete len:413 (+) Transcript_24133:246-1484(+)
MYIVEACFCDVCSVDLTCDIPRCFQIRKEETCWCCYTKGKCGLVRAANSLCYAGRPTDRPIARHKVVGSDHDVLLAAVAVLLLRRPVRVSVHQRRAAPRRTRTVRPPSALLEFCERATAQVPCACSCLPFCLCCPKPACCTTLADYIPASMNNREIPVDPRNLTICAACCCEIVSCYCKVPDCLGCASSAICYCCCELRRVRCFFSLTLLERRRRFRPRGDRMQADGGSVLLLQGDGSLLLRRLPLRAALLVRLADDVHDPPRPPHLPLRQGRLLRQDGRLRRRQPRRPHLRARRPSARARPPARRSPRYRPGTRRHGSRHHHIRPSQRSQRPDPHRPSPGPPSPRPRQHHASPSLAILRQSEWVFLPSFVRFTTKRKKHAACQNHDNEARCATNKSKNSLSSSRSTRVVVV